MALATSTKGAAPDPVAVLRAHRAAVNAVAFHAPSATLLSGYVVYFLSHAHVIALEVGFFRLHAPSGNAHRISFLTQSAIGDLCATNFSISDAGSSRCI